MSTNEQIQAVIAGSEISMSDHVAPQPVMAGPATRRKMTSEELAAYLAESAAASWRSVKPTVAYN